MSSSSVIIYVKLKEKVQVHSPVIKIGDLGEIYSSESNVLTKALSLTAYTVKAPDRKERIIASNVEINRLILKQFYTGDKGKEIIVEQIGAQDIIIEYIPKEQVQVKTNAMEYVRCALLCLFSFIGAAFAIMTFNKDVNVDLVLAQLYQFITGHSSDGFDSIQIGYCIGLPLGIMVFYNHFSKKKKVKDPTPVEVQLRQYEKDINQALVDNNERMKEGKGH